MRRPAARLLLLLSFGVFAACGEGASEAGQAAPPGEVSPARDPVPEFDADSAHALLRAQVAFGPRAPGTAGHARQLVWMEEYLRPRADTVEVQRFTHTTNAGLKLALANVFARFRPDSPDRILLVAHWDTRPQADAESDPERARRPILGANDGASGVAVLLQLADVLSRHSPPIGVDLLLVDGEDWGSGDMYIGATYFAANLPPGYRPYYGVVVDMVGDENPLFPIEGNSQEYAPGVVNRVWRLAEELGLAPYFPRTVTSPLSDDHIPLNRAQIETIDIIDFDYGPGNQYWHTLDDTVEHTSPEGLGVVGRLLTALIFRGG